MPPQRLPVVNADDGTWGNIIRQYLMKEHYNDDTNNADNGGHQKVTIRPGTASAGTAPLKFTSGALLTTPEVGAIEFDGNNLYYTQASGPSRITIVGASATQTLTNKTLTAPRITSASNIADTNGNELIAFPATVASAVNEITVSNAATTGKPSIAATGGDTNITLNLISKGTGTVQANGLDVVAVSGAQTLSGKVIAAGSNTITGLGIAALGGITGTPSSTTYLRGDGTWAAITASGDASTNTATSVDNEVALFNGTTGKSIKRATGTGIATLTSGVLSATATTGTGSVVLGTSPIITTPILNGTPTGSGVVAAGTTASTLALRDTNGNLYANAISLNLTTTATSAGILVMTIASTQVQVFTGTSTHTVRLPTTSITSGTQYRVANNSTGAVTVQSSAGAGNDIVVLAAGTSALFTALTNVPTTAANWEPQYFGTIMTSAKSLRVTNTLTLSGTDATTMTFPAASDTVVTLGATQTLAAKTLTAPRIVNNGFIADANGNELLVAGTTASAVNELKITNAATGTGPIIAAQGGDTNVDLNVNAKGTGHVNINAELDMTNHKVTNVVWPTLDSDGATKGYVDYTSTPIADNGVLFRPTGTSLNTVSPETWQFTHIPHMFNDIAYNNIRGGSVIIRRNGTPVASINEANLFTPDTSHSSLAVINASDVYQIEVTMCRGFDWTAQFGIVQHPSFRAKDIIAERYNVTSGTWTTVESVTDQLTGVYRTMASGWGGANSVTKLRFTLSDFTIAAGESLRITNIFALSYDSPLLSGSFLALGGGTMYGHISNPNNPTNADHLVRKGYVDSKIGTPDASLIIGGDMQTPTLWANSWGTHSTEQSAIPSGYSRKLTSTGAGVGSEFLAVTHDGTGTEISFPAFNSRRLNVSVLVRKHASNAGGGNMVIRCIPINMDGTDAAPVDNSANPTSGMSNSSFTTYSAGFQVGTPRRGFKLRIGFDTGVPSGDIFYIGAVVATDVTGAVMPWTSDILTNKTISGSNNTITNLGTSSIYNVTDLVGSEMVLGGDMQTPSDWTNAWGEHSTEQSLVSGGYSRKLTSTAGGPTVDRIGLLHSGAGSDIGVWANQPRSHTWRVTIRKHASNTGGGNILLRTRWTDYSGASFVSTTTYAESSLSNSSFTALAANHSTTTSYRYFYCYIEMESIPSGDRFYIGSASIVDNSGAVTPTSTQTLTNKRITSRVTTVTSSATPTFNTDNCDLLDITALATNISSMTSGMTGTPTNGQKLMIRIKDNGTPRSITWGANFQSSGVATLLPSTSSSREHHIMVMYSTGVNKWVCLAVDSVGY